ncbi:MAG: NADH-quinone oxidoreductase subunit A [Desulfobacterales bacterium]
MTLDNYAVVGMATLMVFGGALIGAALCRPAPVMLAAPRGWKPYSIGFPVYALIFLSFDMEMIFMYPWAVVFVEQGFKGFMDMLVFICILSAGIAYAWGMGGFKWE